MTLQERFNSAFNKIIQDYLLYKNPKLKESPEKLEQTTKAFIYHYKADPYIQALSENISNLDDMVSHFGDEESLQVYVQELCYIAAKHIEPTFAQKFASPVPFDDFCAKKTANSQPFLELVKDLTFTTNDQDQLIDALYTIFMMREYAYESKDSEKLFGVDPGEVVIDGGAFLGDTAAWFYREGAAKVYSFEPVPFALEVLKRNLEANKFDPELTVPFAISDQRKTVNFMIDPNHLAGCLTVSKDKIEKFLKENTKRISNKSDLIFQEIQTISLDEWCAETQIEPTLIKLDIEGAELDALEGMRNTITRLKPKLAICLYHVPSHMWQLPQKILEFNPNYTFYCKKSHPLYETVLFAVDRTK